MNERDPQTTTRPWPDPPELAHMPGQFILGYRQAPADAAGEIERLRAVIRVNALRWVPGITHEEIDRIIEGKNVPDADAPNTARQTPATGPDGRGGECDD